MAARKSQSPKPRKRGFSHHLWVADENGNIFFIKRDEKQAIRLTGVKVAGAKDRFDFTTKNELIDQKLIPPNGQRDDRSVAVVKMLLAMGVTTAAIPKDFIDPGDNATVRGTSYVINLASFDTENVFWPGADTAQIQVRPSTRKK
jgi:hypothetical protein